MRFMLRHMWAGPSPHIEIQVRQGAPGESALLGTLRMNGKEWLAFRKIFEDAKRPDDPFAPVIDIEELP